MTREAQQVYSELAQFGKPRGLDLSLCRRLSPLASRCAYLQCHLTVANARSLMRWSAPITSIANFRVWLRVLKNLVFEAFRMRAGTKVEVFFSASARWPGGFGLFGSCD